MKSFPITWLLVFLATWLVSGLIAAMLIVPLFQTAFGNALRQDPGGMGFITVGSALMALVTTLLFRAQDAALPAVQRGLNAGGWTALLLVANYLVVAGWSTMDAVATIGSGLLSAIAPVLGGLVAGLYNKPKAS